MTYTLDSNSLGSVRSIRFSTVERADVMGMPFDDSDDTLVLSFEGVVRKITLVGIYTGTTTQIDTFIDTIHALQDGQQGGGSGYTFATGADDMPKSMSLTVHLEDFQFTWGVDAYNVLDYTLKLIERA